MTHGLTSSVIGDGELGPEAIERSKWEISASEKDDDRSFIAFEHFWIRLIRLNVWANFQIHLFRVRSPWINSLRSGFYFSIHSQANYVRPQRQNFQRIKSSSWWEWTRFRFRNCLILNICLSPFSWFRSKSHLFSAQIVQ